MRYTTRIIVPPKVRRSGQPGAGGAYQPQVLGVRKSFGFDDPFGLASIGHIGAAERHPDIAPIFAQSDFQKPHLPGRSKADVLAGVLRAVNQARFRQPWGADANLLRTPQEVDDAAASGFTYYTFDPSEHLSREADQLPPEQVVLRLQALVEEGSLSEDWSQHYVNRTIELPGNRRLVLTLEPLQRAAVKYTRAIRHCGRLAESAARASHGRPYEMEAYFAAPGPRTTPLEHLFIGLELEARGVRLTGLALNLIDQDGQSDARATDAGIEQTLREHAAFAEFCGPYKLSFHDVSMLPSLHPIIANCCGEGMHMKSRHLSYLEALRVVLLTNPGLFEKIASLTHPDSAAFADAVQGEPGQAGGANLLTSAYLARSSALLTETRDAQGQLLFAAVVEVLERHADIYQAQLTTLFDKRLSLLKAV